MSEELLRVFQLTDDIRTCIACPIRTEAYAPVPFVGNPHSRVMIVGRNPGRDENAQGVPFIGRGGKKLDEVFKAVGIERSKLLITNLAKCYTTNDRQPTDDEYQTCIDLHLKQELLHFKPAIIVALGKDAARFLMGNQDASPARAEYRKQFIPCALLPLALVCTVMHPGSALRTPTYDLMLAEDFAWLVGTPQFQQAYQESCQK